MRFCASLFERRRAGFTLVEMMVTVSIIGILSAVAIPNYQKFQAKSRTTEAKIQLAKAYSAESFALVSYDVYVSCLNYAGYNPIKTYGSRYYAVGVKGSNSIANTLAVKAGMNDSCKNALADQALGTMPSTAGVDHAIYFYHAGKTANRDVDSGTLQTLLYDAVKNVGMGEILVALTVVGMDPGPPPTPIYDVTTKKYIIAAAGIVSNKEVGSNPVVDVWTLDETKKVTHVQVGF